MLRSLTRAWVVAAILLAYAGGSAPAAAAPAIGGISVRPVAADGTPLETAYIDVERAAPSTFTASIEITNATDRAIPVRVAAVDTTTSENGGTAFLATDSARRRAGAWISPGRQALTLGAEATTRLDFTVRVPGGAAPGDHVGGIVIEPERRVKLQSTADITRIVRVAMAVRVRVPGDAPLGLEMRLPRFARGEDGGPPSVTVELANTGARLCRPYLRATFSSGGRVQSAERRHVETLLPGDAVDYTVRWARPVPDGSYDLEVRAEGCGAQAAVRENLVIDSAGNARVASATPAVTPQRAGLSGTVQLTALAAALLASAAAGWSLARWRPGRRRR